MSATYPATTNDEAVALNVQTSNQFSEVINGSITKEVTTYEGNGPIPSVSKALYDAAAYKVPTAWSAGGTETDLMQPREYNNRIYVPLAVPADMDSVPDSTQWRLYSNFHPYRAILQKEVQTGADVVGGVSTLTTMEYEIASNSLIVFVDGSLATEYSETTTTSITWNPGSEPTALQEIVFIAGSFVSLDTLYDEIITARDEAVAAARATVVDDVTTSHTVVQAEENSYRRFNNASDITVTVEPQVTETIEVGSAFHFNQVGAGQVIFAEGVGVTINTAETLKTRKAGSPATLIYVGSDTWDLNGDLELAP